MLLSVEREKTERAEQHTKGWLNSLSIQRLAQGNEGEENNDGIPKRRQQQQQ